MRAVFRLALTAVLASGALAFASSASAGTILFQSNHCNFEPGCIGYQLYTAPDSGGSPTRITNLDCGTGAGSWSPDGSAIAFSHRARSAPGAGCTQANIWLMNPDGSGMRALTSGPFDEDFPDFSPDGRTVVFDSSDGSPLAGHHEIWKIGTDGRSLVRLTSTSADEETPHFSVDGRTILYTRSPGSATARFTGSPVNIWAMNADGSDQHALTVGGGFLSGVSFSPDGCNIAFSNNGRIFTMTVDGLGLVAHTDRPGRVYDVEPNWSPDGTRIAFGRTTLTAGGDELSTDLFSLSTASDTAALVATFPPTAGGVGYQVRYVDWFASGSPSRVCGSADRVAPVTLLAGSTDVAGAVSLGGTGSGATSARSLSIHARKSKLAFTTIDRSGVKSVAVSISTAPKGGRCRQLAGGHLGPLRSCAPRYRRVSDTRGLRKLVAALPKGRYVFRFSALDRRGNRTRNPRAATVILR